MDHAHRVDGFLSHLFLYRDLQIRGEGVLECGDRGGPVVHEGKPLFVLLHGRVFDGGAEDQTTGCAFRQVGQRGFVGRVCRGDGAGYPPSSRFQARTSPGSHRARFDRFLLFDPRTLLFQSGFALAGEDFLLSLPDPGDRDVLVVGLLESMAAWLRAERGPSGSGERDFYFAALFGGGQLAHSGGLQEHQAFQGDCAVDYGGGRRAGIAALGLPHCQRGGARELSGPQRFERIVGLFQEEGVSGGVNGVLGDDFEKLVFVLSREIGHGADASFLPKGAVGDRGCRSCGCLRRPPSAFADDGGGRFFEVAIFAVRPEWRLLKAAFGVSISWAAHPASKRPATARPLEIAHGSRQNRCGWPL